MSKNCPNCKAIVLKKWIYFDSILSIYECPNCATKIKWTFMKTVFSCLGFLSGFLIIILTKDSWSYNNNLLRLGLSFTIGLLCYFLFAIVIPAAFLSSFSKIVKIK